MKKEQFRLVRMEKELLGSRLWVVGCREEKRRGEIIKVFLSHFLKFALASRCLRGCLSANLSRDRE